MGKQQRMRMVSRRHKRVGMCRNKLKWVELANYRTETIGLDLKKKKSSCVVLRRDTARSDSERLKIKARENMYQANPNQ